VPDEKKTSHEVLAEKRLEIEQAVPPYKPHEVKEGAVLPGQVYEKYKSMDPKDFEEWMKSAPDIDNHPFAHLFDPEWFSEFKELRRTEDPEYWARVNPDYKNRSTAYTPEEWRRGAWKIYPNYGTPGHLERLKELDYIEYLEKHKPEKRETPDPSKLLS